MAIAQPAFVDSGILFLESGQSAARYGARLAVADDIIAVSAHEYDGAANCSAPCENAGLVTLYQNVNGNWLEIQQLQASDARPGDLFGYALGLVGDRLLVAAPFADVADNCGATVCVDSGAVYVFERGATGWSETGVLTGSDTTNFDIFGESLAVDGDTLVVGAPSADDLPTCEFNNCSDGGAVYVFSVDETGFTETQILSAPDGEARDYFGRRVAVSGTTIAAAAPEADDAPGCSGPCERSGAVYTFVLDPMTEVWQDDQILTASDAAASDLFGIGLTLDLDTLVVGAPLADDAPACIGGSCGDAGAAYVFTLTDTWTESAILTAGVADANDQFATSLVLRGDLLLVGLNEFPPPSCISNCTVPGAVLVFSDTGDSWSEVQRLNGGSAESRFGLAIALDGDTLVAGAPGTDGDCGDESCADLGEVRLYTLTVPADPLLVTTTADDGPGSLRAALAAANAATEAATVRFAIPGDGPHRIEVLSSLAVDSATQLDATTQPGTDCETGTWQVILDGSGASGDGVTVSGTGSRIRGLVIQNFPGAGVAVGSGASSAIQCNAIGTDATASMAAGNGSGIRLDTAAGGLIGGATVGSGNVVAANTGSGISASLAEGGELTVQGNTIGGEGLGNSGDGLVLTTASDGFRVIANTVTHNRNGLVLDGGTVIQDNRFENHAQVGVQIQAVGSGVAPSGNCFVANSGLGLNNVSAALVTAEDNWWEADDGPGGNGPGSGDGISARVDAVPFLTSPASGCPYPTTQLFQDGFED